MIYHATNLLVLETDDRDIIARFRYVFTTTDKKGSAALSLNRIIPEPPQLTYYQKIDDISDELLKWREYNWGVKSDVKNIYGTSNDPDNYFYFSSSWAPPFKAILKLSGICKDLKMSMYSSIGYPDQGAYMIAFINGLMADTYVNDTHNACKIYLQTHNMTVDECEYIHVDDNGRYYYQNKEDE